MIAAPHDHGRLALGLQLAHLLVERGGNRLARELFKEESVANMNGLPSERRADATRCKGLELLSGLKFHLSTQSRLSILNDCCGQWVIAQLLNGHGDAEQFGLRHAFHRGDGGQFRLALGQRSCFVECDGRKAAQILERSATLDQHALPCSSRHTRQHRARRRYGQGTG